MPYWHIAQKYWSAKNGHDAQKFREVIDDIGLYANRDPLFAELFVDFDLDLARWDAWWESEGRTEGREGPLRRKGRPLRFDPYQRRSPSRPVSIASSEYEPGSHDTLSSRSVRSILSLTSED